jgi:hypothetical protein
MSHRKPPASAALCVRKLRSRRRDGGNCSACDREHAESDVAAHDTSWPSRPIPSRACVSCTLGRGVAWRFRLRYAIAAECWGDCDMATSWDATRRGLCVARGREPDVDCAGQPLTCQVRGMDRPLRSRPRRLRRAGLQLGGRSDMVCIEFRGHTMRRGEKCRNRDVNAALL